MIKQMLDELNLENSSNYKMEVLKKHKGNKLLQRVLKMTYDKVTYTYGITMKNIAYTPESMRDINVNLEYALDVLEEFFVTREWTGNKAIQALTNLLSKLSKDDAEVLEKIINRDLRINMGRSNINKVFKNLIVKPPYMRCGLYSDKTAKKIDFTNGAYIQLKADGMAMFVEVTQTEVICRTRSGEEFTLDSLQYLKNNSEFVDNVIQGEFLIDGEFDRSVGNGLLNSLIKYKQSKNNSLSEKEAKEIEDKILFQVWDLIPINEYRRGKDKNNKTIYEDRFKNLVNALHTNP